MKVRTPNGAQPREDAAMHERRLRDVIKREQVVSVDGGSNVVEATKLMTRSGVGAVLVVNGSRLEGIFTERDLVNRVVAQGLDPKSTMVADVMTSSIHTATLDTKAVDALRLMQENGFRHLPICDDDRRPIAMVSLRDFLGSEMAEVQDEIAFEDTIERELW